MGKQIVKVQTVASLAGLIKAEIEKCKYDIIEYADNSKLKMYWTIGKYIKQHLEYKKGAENYGQHVVMSLAETLGVNFQVLYDCVKLYEYYPEILNSANLKCFWTHYRLLLKLKDPALREKYRQLVVRLRGINTPGIDSADGVKSRDYIVACLSGCSFVLIKSHSRDKFNRYLVDIFFQKNPVDIAGIINAGRFLNQELLDKGLASEYIV